MFFIIKMGDLFIAILPKLMIFVCFSLIGIILLQKSLSDGGDGILTPPSGNLKNAPSSVDGVTKLTRILIVMFFGLILLNGFMVKRKITDMSIANKIMQNEERNKLLPKDE